MTSPLGPLLAKLRAGQDATIQVLGDSTAYGSLDGTTSWTTVGYGWGGRLTELLAQSYDVNAVLYLTNAPPLGYGVPTAYYSPVTIHTSSQGSSAPTLTVWDGAWPGSLLGNDISYANVLLQYPTPDVVIIQDGFNETSLATFASNYPTFIGIVQSSCNNAPIIVTTANLTPGVTGESGNSVTFAQIWQTLLDVFLPASSLPLSPPLQSSTTTTGVWVLDTQQANLTTADIFEGGADDIHPNATGYQMQAQWMFGTLIPNTSTSSGTYGWTYDAPITPYSHLPWQVPFTLGGPAGKSTGTYSFTGTATGHATHSGSASGTYSWHAAAAGNNGTATPSTLPWQLPTQLSSSSLSGTAAGTYSWHAAAAGNNGNVRGTTLPWTLPVTIGTTNSSSASGNYSWSGTAAGISPHAGNGTGTYIFAGNATGSTTHNGAASGTYSWYAAAAGNSTHSGKATGTYVFNGNATGLAPLVDSGSATGRFSWVGNVIGHATHSGAASGNYSWHTAAVGSTTKHGSATGVIGWVGSAIGLAPTVSGHTIGHFAWVADAQGVTTKHGAASGVYGWVGSAKGPTSAPPHAAWTVVVSPESRSVVV